jgi:hypothetical protein
MSTNTGREHATRYTCSRSMVSKIVPDVTHHCQYYCISDPSLRHPANGRHLLFRSLHFCSERLLFSLFAPLLDPARTNTLKCALQALFGYPPSIDMRTARVPAIQDSWEYEHPKMTRPLGMVTINRLLGRGGIWAHDASWWK